MSEYLVTRQALIEFAWSAPMRELADRIGMSDVGLKKLLRAHGIISPPQGHWNRVHAGRNVPAAPNAGPRRPGETGRLGVDARFAGHVPAIDPLPAAGPFASPAVPEDLEELRAQVLATTPKIAVPRTLDHPHPGLSDLLKREARRATKQITSSWLWDTPLFASAYWQRQLRFWNALFHALAPWGGGNLREESHQVKAWAQIGDSHVQLRLVPVGKIPMERVAGELRPGPEAPAKAPLQLTIGQSAAPLAVFSDGLEGTLERQIREIVAALVTAGEARFRDGLREHQEWLAQQNRWQEEARQRQLVAEEKVRAERLAVHAAHLREADDIRALVARVAAGSASTVAADDAATWSAWALARADRLDPIASGILWAEFDETSEDRTRIP